MVYATTVGIGGLLANGLVIFVFIYFKYLRTVTNNFIVNLAVCDFVLALLDLVFSIPSLIASEWIFGHRFGVFYAFFHFFLVCSSMVMLAIIAVDRYYVIARSKLRTKITSLKSQIVIGVVYAYTFVIASPILYAPAILKVEIYKSGCYIDFTPTLNFGSISYSLVMVTFLYLAPLIIIVLHYWKIFNVLRKRRKRASKTNAVQNRRLRDTSRGGFCRISTRSHQVKTLRVMATLVGLFVATWTPYMVVTLARAFNQRKYFSDGVKELTIQLMKLVVVLNPIAYAMVNHRFQKCIAKLFCCTRVVLGGMTTDNSLEFYRPSRSNRTSAHEPYRSSYTRQDVPREWSNSEEAPQNSQTPVQFVYNDNHLREHHAKSEPRQEEFHEAGIDRGTREVVDLDELQRLGVDTAIFRSTDSEVLVTCV